MPGPGRLARAWQVFLVSSRLGLTSFGGPVAHLGYYREEYVRRRKWLTDEEYADLVALCQFLPGPASTQVSIAIGMKRAGQIGALLAWLGFTMPSAVAMVLFAYGVAATGNVADAGWLHGLKIVAVAVVAWAVWGMARSLCPDRPRVTLAILAAAGMLAAPNTAAQVGVIIVGGILGWTLLRSSAAAKAPIVAAPARLPIAGRWFAIGALAVFFVLLAGLPVLRQVIASEPLNVFDSFYRSGSLVFGGGHVVLPLLQAEVVPTGWVTDEEFIAGYGAAQAVPGPLFTFAAYLGASIESMPAPWLGGLLALIAIFLPSYLLVAGALPFWDRIRQNAPFRRALMGINAAVVGLLIAALYDPVWTSAIHAPKDFGLGLVAFGLLAFWKLPPWLVVVGAALGGWALA
ncbi:MAG: chromate efflux transporter [Chloroflexi bacterium]|nr:chromate efflux transporter [Chloroflexota bacterium]